MMTKIGLKKYNNGMSKQGLPPLLCENPRILILGSLPGDKSIEMQQYYGHPRNRFWQVMASVLGKPLPDDYTGKKKLLSDAGIILWDVYHSAERDGSLDSDIKNPEFNDLFTLLKENPSIRVIATNGKTAERAFQKWNDTVIKKAHGLNHDIVVYGMPSTSPANASWTLKELVNQWGRILIDP